MAWRDTFTGEVPKEIVEEKGFSEWEESVDGSEVVRVEAMISTIRNEGVITNAKSLGEGLYEKKWNSGLRLYFAVIEEGKRKTLLILGSGKGAEQTRAIREAHKTLKRYKVFKGNIGKKD